MTLKINFANFLNIAIYEKIKINKKVFAELNEKRVFNRVFKNNIQLKVNLKKST